MAHSNISGATVASYWLENEGYFLCGFIFVKSLESNSYLVGCLMTMLNFII